MFPPAPGGRQRAPFESSSSFDQPDLGGGVGGLGLEEAFTPELKEKMVRLEKENEIMRRRLDSNLSESVEPSLLGKFGEFCSLVPRFPDLFNKIGEPGDEATISVW